MESVKGCTKQVSMRVQATCERCNGTGGEPGTKTRSAPTVEDQERSVSHTHTHCHDDDHVTHRK